MSRCHHAHHQVVLEVFEHLARENGVPVKRVMDGVFLSGFEPLIADVYEVLDQRVPGSDGVVYCCPKCGSFDLVSEEVAQYRGYECSTQ